MVHENYLKAGNPNTTTEELRELLADENNGVRRRLAENPHTPEDVLLALAKDEDAEVRTAVAENEKTPREVLEHLINDSSVHVRYALAGLYKLPIDLLEQLAQEDDNPYVKDHAKRTLEGIFLEEELKKVGFVVPQPAHKDKLGELLIAADLISGLQLEELLRIAKEKCVPLGHALVESHCVSRSVVVAALKAQVGLRNNLISHQEAVWQIRQAIR